MLPGIDAAQFFPRQGGADRHKWRIGTLCRLEPRKNVLTVIEGLRWLQARTSTRIEYVLAGDGPERGRILKALAASGLEWRYYGRIDEAAKVREFYPSLDAFALVPTALKRDVEGFGLVYLEANASGVPVVAAATGGIESAVKDGVSGRFADPTSAADVGRAIEAVIVSGEQLRRSAVAWAQTLSARRAAEAFCEVYHELTAAPQAGRV
jgi:glycosyltransferase involved in cell wall biosynthesis